MAAPFGSHEREAQRQVVHLLERVQFALEVSTLGTSQAAAAPERAT